MIETDEKLTLLNVINHWKFKEVEAEVKRLREVNEMQRKTLLNIEGFLETWRDAE